LDQRTVKTALCVDTKDLVGKTTASRMPYWDRCRLVFDATAGNSLAHNTQRRATLQHDDATPDDATHDVAADDVVTDGPTLQVRRRGLRGWVQPGLGFARGPGATSVPADTR
jgi:hypothetical protein